MFPSAAAPFALGLPKYGVVLVSPTSCRENSDAERADLILYTFTAFVVNGVYAP